MSTECKGDIHPEVLKKVQTTRTKEAGMTFEETSGRLSLECVNSDLTPRRR